MASDRRRAQAEDASELAETIGLYALGEISLGRAAERANVSRWEMQEILEDAGVELRLGPQSDEELEDEVDVALDLE
ncbi:UPF0175 family protein [Halorussus sp. MSC15.2]|uniref:UPF0175 family protein n=1 Tax=Halorussus sp. MSC15.2 TaxID=2283638 RepID=UPI0013D75A9D|nr:UPF0175 family protein [Halorussus sp. MSC15.2]NEU58566.1 hypothetical protein [Halorussus sp. MSC15.2]